MDVFYFNILKTANLNRSYPGIHRHRKTKSDEMFKYVLLNI